MRSCAGWIAAYTLRLLAVIGRESWDFLAGIRSYILSVPGRVAARIAGIGYNVAVRAIAYAISTSVI